MKGSFDIAIVGSGFSGSLLAILCRRLGRSVVLIERGSHPRFAIGESSSPLANLVLEPFPVGDIGDDGDDAGGSSIGSGERSGGDVHVYPGSVFSLALGFKSDRLTAPHCFR